MIKRNRQYSKVSLVSFCTAVCIVLIATPGFCARQGPAQLQIDSPANGSVVNPGQVISITVTSPANTVFTSVAVIAEDPLDLTNIAASVPAQFSLTIPTNIPCGKYMLTADGTTAAGQTVESAPILIDVERGDPAVGLSASLLSFSFHSAGDQSSARLLATFEDNSVLDVTRSTLTSYASSNTAVATVDASSGSLVVTAVAPGKATVTATYNQGVTNLVLSIPLVVSPPLGASPPLLNFPGTAVGASSAHQTVTLINSSKSSINLLGVSTTGDFSQTNTCTSPLGTEVTCSLDVVFQPSAAGVRTGSLVVTNSSTPATFIVPLTGTGISDFSISSNPAAQAVALRGSTTYAVSTSSIGGFTSSISLSVAGLPSGATASFTPTTISGGAGSSTLKVSAGSNTPLGTFVLTITGTSVLATHSVTVSLTVNRR